MVLLSLGSLDVLVIWVCFLVLWSGNSFIPVGLVTIACFPVSFVSLLRPRVSCIFLSFLFRVLCMQQFPRPLVRCVAIFFLIFYLHLLFLTRGALSEYFYTPSNCVRMYIFFSLRFVLPPFFLRPSVFCLGDINSPIHPASGVLQWVQNIFFLSLYTKPFMWGRVCRLKGKRILYKKWNAHPIFHYLLYAFPVQFGCQWKCTCMCVLWVCDAPVASSLSPPRSID